MNIQVKISRFQEQIMKKNAQSAKNILVNCSRG